MNKDLGFQKTSACEASENSSSGDTVQVNTMTELFMKEGNVENTKNSTEVGSLKQS